MTNRPGPDGPDFYTINQFLALVGLNRSRLYQLWAQGLGHGPPRVVHHEPGRHRRVLLPRREADAWISRRYGWLPPPSKKKPRQGD